MPYKKNILITSDKAKVQSVIFNHEIMSTKGDKVSKVDVVINNNYGVNNSKLLGLFSTNQYVKKFGLLVKLWGKKHDLINPKKFSSYEFVLMMLFFMMNSGKIEFLTADLLDQNKPNFKLPHASFH